MKRAFLVIAAALAAGGCAADKLTLVKDDEGNTGAVAVIDEVSGADKAVANTDLSETKLGKRPKTRTVKELKPAYSTLLGNLPPRAEQITILFPKDVTEIPDDQLDKIAKIRKARDDRPGAHIEVVGFTDALGDVDLNQGISERRALAVINQLAKYDLFVDPNDAVGRGERDAKAETGDEVPSEKWRRVDVVVR